MIRKSLRLAAGWSFFYLLSLFWVPLWPFAEEIEQNKTIHESESETIAKCLEDLKSDAVDVRKRAVLILGKYSNHLARSGVIRSLSDSNPDIRRSALVSLTEKPVTRDAAKPMLKMIGDPDVHIRRIASSYIPEILRGYGGPRFFHLGGSSVGKSSEDLKKIITRAFIDIDTIVRKNMMTHYHYFREFLNKDTLKQLLNDSDREVRVLALNASVAVFQGREFIDIASSMSSDPDSTIRQRLTEILANTNTPAAVEVLQKLTKDEEFEISTAAFLALFKRSDLSVYPELRKRLDSPKVSSQTVTNIIRLIPMMGNDGEQALVELINSPDPSLRHTALEVYGQSYGDKANVTMLTELMTDQSKRIRETASRIFLRLPEFVVEDLNALVTSPYADVRRTVLILSRRISTAQVKSVLMELILDDIIDIRILALQEVVQRRVDGWESIVELTLTDDTVEIQQKTVMLLLKKRSPKTDGILLNFARVTDNTMLKQLILNGLNKGYNQPNQSL